MILAIVASPAKKKETKMKVKLTLIVVTASLFLIPYSRLKATNTQPSQPRAAVVFVGSQTVSNTITVYLSSTSVGAPSIPPHTSMGDAIAVYLTAGYHFDHVEGLVVYMSN